MKKLAFGLLTAAFLSTAALAYPTCTRSIPGLSEQTEVAWAAQRKVKAKVKKSARKGIRAKRRRVQKVRRSRVTIEEPTIVRRRRVIRTYEEEPTVIERRRRVIREERSGGTSVNIERRGGTSTTVRQRNETGVSTEQRTRSQTNTNTSTTSGAALWNANGRERLAYWGAAGPAL